MPNTAKNALPYPDINDPARDGALDMQALAQAIDARLVKYGRTTATSDGGGKMLIPHGLGRVPTFVMAVCENSTYVASAALSQATSTNLGVYIRRIDNGAVQPNTPTDINWLAI